jgi:CHAT domain-containing protein
VTDPDFDAALYPELPRLGAAAIAGWLPRILPGSRVLRDRDATRAAFLAAAGSFPIVHFGGHSVLNSQFPLLSQLLFAKVRSTDPDANRGVLYSGDLLGRRFDRTRLVVLASCSTAVGKISRTEGIESIARPFLATGVPAVVASLWGVEDRATDGFFVDFYRHLALRRDAVLALQAAQLDALAAPTDQEPYLWGAFELIGAAASGQDRRFSRDRGDRR